MTQEAAPQQPDWRAFLGSYYGADFVTPRTDFDIVETAYAKWEVHPHIEDGARKILALRTSETGTIDSFSINLDDPEDIKHATIEADEGISSLVISNVMEVEAGMPPDPEGMMLAHIDELVSTLMLFSEFD